MKTTAILVACILIAYTADCFDLHKHQYAKHCMKRSMGLQKLTAFTPDGSERPTEMSAAPKLIVFDLDNTLWTPELYFIRNLDRGAKPVARKDIDLFPGAQEVLQMIRDGKFYNTQFALASRTSSVDWAHDLLQQFNIRHLFHYVEIYPGDKTAHFSKLRAASGISYRDMLFFDDARHGKYGNCLPVAEMGVLSVHCPNGLQTTDLFHMALKRYEEWNGSKGAVVEWDGSLTYSIGCTSSPNAQTKRHHGRVQFVNYEKSYGFIRYKDIRAKDIYFQFSGLPVNVNVRQGDNLSCTVHMDSKNNKPVARDIALVSGEDSTSVSSEDSASSTSMASSSMVALRAFSMNMPFAALLANGYKTLETRSGTMFVPYPEGTQMLLHVGQRTYPDGDRHMEIMKNHGLTEDEIRKLKELPTGFERGSIVAICELGRTMEMSLEERSAPWIQRQVAAYGKDSGKMVTEIRSVQYLKHSFPIGGQGGVFKVQIPANILPDNWKLNVEEYGSSEPEQPSRYSDGTDSSSKPIYSITG